MIKYFPRIAAVAVTAIATVAIASSVSGAESLAPAQSDSTDLPATHATPADKLSEKTLRSVASGGASVDILDKQKFDTRITPKEAITIGAGSFGFVNGGKVAEIALVRMTDSTYGKQLETDTGKRSRIEPIIEDKMVWVVVYSGFTMPQLGQESHPDDDGSSTSVPGEKGSSSMWFAIDPTSGAVLEGKQIINE